MGEKLKATALVVEDDQIQRAMVAMLLEETDIQVIQCESAEAAELVLEKVGGCLCMVFTDVYLAGRMTGAELATKDDLESMRAEVSGVRSEVADFKSDMHTLRAALTSPPIC